MLTLTSARRVRAAARTTCLVFYASLAGSAIAGGVVPRPLRAQAARARAATGRGAQLPAPALDPATAVANEIAIVTFLGGGTPLSPAEQQQVAGAVAAGLRADASRWSRNSRGWMAALAKSARNPQYAAETRENGRAGLEFVPPRHSALDAANAAELAVVRAHDPAVVVDVPHKRLVTEQSLAALRQAATVTAQAAGVSGPDANFAGAARRGLRAEWAQLLPAQSDGFAHAAANGPYTAAFLKAAPRTGVSRLLGDVRRDVLAGRDVGERQWQLARAAALLSAGGRTYVQRQMMYGALAMNQMMFGQMMQTQQRNNAHASRGETFQTTPY